MVNIVLIMCVIYKYLDYNTGYNSYCISNKDFLLNVLKEPDKYLMFQV